MRYADSPRIEVSTLVAAPLERVWSLVSDIGLPARFSEEFLGAEWLDEVPRPGARFRGRNRHPALGDWQTVCFVSRYEPMREFAWDVGDQQDPSANWRFLLERQDEAVLLTFGARMGPAPSGLSIAIAAMPAKEERIVSRRLQDFERNMRATIDGIRSLAEANA